MAAPVLGTDTGGTFTDFVLVSDGTLTVHKLPSTPEDPSRAVMEGVEALALPLDATVAHGSTVATNALLERKGARTALVTTEGFEDLLQIGRQARTRLYDLEYRPPDPLVPRELRFGLHERVGPGGVVFTAPSASDIELLAARLAELGVEAAAVSLLYSFLRPAHEEAVRAAIQRAVPELFVSISSEVLPEFREYERTSTVVTNAYVGPLMSRYLDRMGDALGRPLRIMQSSGGSTTVDLARSEPVRTILSGPAGGVIGATYMATVAGYDQVITLDMGGTSTDVALCPGRVQTATDYQVDGLPIGVPVIDIRTVGAGGGSIARLDEGGALRVGPESAGASPGPACYGQSSLPTVTDANLVLGRLVPDRFLGGRMAIDGQLAKNAIGEVAKTMGVAVHDAALGIVRVANTVMERAVRNVSLERGFDPRQFTLVAFGGAGPQHACELATTLGMGRVLIPRHPGVLSALGVAISDVRKDYSRTVMTQDPGEMRRLERELAGLEARAITEIEEEGFVRSEVSLVRALDVRYRGQSFELPVDWPADGRWGSVAASFQAAHLTRFGYADERAAIEVVNVRVQAVVPTVPPALARQPIEVRPVEPEGEIHVWFTEGPTVSKFYERERLRPGHAIEGPALVVQMDATTVVPPRWRADVDDWGNLVLVSSQPQEA